MENLSTEATYALVLSIATLITSLAGWINAARNTKMSKSAAEARAEAVKLETQEQILANNRHFQKEIDDLKNENAARVEEKHQSDELNKKLSDELKAQLDGQARERLEFRAEISNYQEIALRQGRQLASNENDIRELQTQVAGFKALADELKEDRNRVKAELDKTIQERDAALLLIAEKDATITALRQEKDAVIEQFEGRIKKLEDDLSAKNDEIAKLVEQMAALTLQNQLEDVPTEPKPIGLTGAIIDGVFKAETLPPEGAA